jgi:hypothetical protein
LTDSAELRAYQATIPRRVPDLNAALHRLLHRAIDEDPNVIDALADWINRRSAKRPAKN